VDRRRRVAAVVLVLYFPVAWVVIVLGSAWLFDEDPDWTKPIIPLVGGVLGATVIPWWQRRRVGALLLPQLNRAVRTGTLPNDADPGVWRSMLLQEKRAWRRYDRVVRAALLGIAAVVLVLGLVLHADTTPLLIGVAVIAGIAGVPSWATRRRERRIDGLLDQLAG
jgi:hypothetical protein